MMPFAMPTPNHPLSYSWCFTLLVGCLEPGVSLSEDIDPEFRGDDDDGSCGVINGDDECDDGQYNSDTGKCTTSCHIAVCGDGLVSTGVEQCDDDNGVDGDGCTNACKLAKCGDSIVHAGIEECDDGNKSMQDSCSTNCTCLGVCEPPSEVPELTLDISPVKQFDFSWTPSDGATQYSLFEDGDWVTKVTGSTSESLTVPLHWSQGASYTVKACNSAGCVESDPVQVAGSLVEAIGYFKASNTFDQHSGEFGEYLALSGDGNTLAIGVPDEDTAATGIDNYTNLGSAQNSGAVYVYTRDPMTLEWASMPTFIKAPNTGESDGFGVSVALSNDGKTLAVGAGGEDGQGHGVNPVDDQPNGGLAMVAAEGAAYVYHRDPMTLEWSDEVTYIKASNDSEDFGRSVALSGDGNTLAVGGPLESGGATGINGDQNDDTAEQAGAVYVYARNPMTLEWTGEIAYVKASNTDALDRFGWVVALNGDGTTLAVSSTREASSASGINGDQADDSAANAGAVYVYTRNPMKFEWSGAITYIKASNTAAQDTFGISVSLTADGNMLAVGARNEDSSATGIDGNQADNSAQTAGAVYVYVRDPMTLEWSGQPTYFKSSNTEAGDAFGPAMLSADGSTLVVGAPGEDSIAVGIGGDQADNSLERAGAVYVYARDPMTLEWLASPTYVKASNTPEVTDNSGFYSPPFSAYPGDRFGVNVAVSGDGSTIAVGAPWEDSEAIGLGGDQEDNSSGEEGAVYLY
jgi:cysteine-rich repeat protein